MKLAHLNMDSTRLMLKLACRSLKPVSVAISWLEGKTEKPLFWICKTVLILFLTNYRTPSPLILDQNYINTKNQVIKAERRVLKELGFCVHVKHPHKVSCQRLFYL